MANKIELGQEVIVSKAIGRDYRGDLFETLFPRFFYRYGGDIFDIPFGARGIVSEIKNNAIRVRFMRTDLEYHQWDFHKDELKSLPIPGSIRQTEFETHPLLEMSRQTPILVADDKVFSLEEQEGTKKPVEIATLSSLDEMFFSRNQDRIERAEEIYKNHFFNISSNLSDIPRKIFFGIFPYLRDEGYNQKTLGILSEDSKNLAKQPEPAKPAQKPEEEIISGSLEEKIEKIEEELTGIKKEIEEFPFEKERRKGKIASILNYLSKIFQRNEKRNKRQEKLDSLLYEEVKEYSGRGEDYTGSSLLSQAVGERAYILYNGQVQSLVVSPKKGEIKLGGKSYKLGERRSLDFSQRRYQDLVTRKIAFDTIDTKLSKERVQDILMGKESDFQYEGMTDYEEEDFGFTKHEGRYFVYIKAPEFAIKSPHDEQYYLFGESKIGFEVFEGGGILSYNPYPFMVQNNMNPFTSVNNNFCGLCIGGNRLPTEGKDMGEVIAKSLRKVRNIMLFGYFAGVSPYRGLNTRNYSSERIKTLNELKKRGVLISDGTRIGRK